MKNPIRISDSLVLDLDKVVVVQATGTKNGDMCMVFMAGLEKPTWLSMKEGGKLIGKLGLSTKEEIHHPPPSFLTTSVPPAPPSDDDVPF